MIDSIKVYDIKGITEPIELVGLGKINIICGKNNSGKTSLLEGISNPEKSTIGKRIEAKDIDVILDTLTRGNGWGLSNRPDHPHVQRYRQIIEEVIHKKEAWFIDEASVFAREVHELYIVSSVKQRPAGNTQKVFNDLLVDLNERPKTVLLPSKRILELSIAVNSGQTIVPNGNGILNYLFFGKNQSDSDDNYKLIQSLNEAFIEISGGYHYDVIIAKNNQLTLRFAAKDKPWLDALDCGLGLQDLLIILYFSLRQDIEVVLIEEPESHLHPEFQKKLLLYLNKDTSKQFFISTHSNIFLNNSLINKVFFTTCDECVRVSDETTRSSILNDLGYSVSDNLVSDLVIFVEGPKDVPVIEEFLLKFGISQKYNIKTWPMGGDIMDQLDLSIFKESHPIVALIDNDPRSSVTRKRFKNKCKEYQIPVIQLKRYAIESYFTVEALREVFGEQIPEQVTEIKPDIKIEEQLGFSVKKSNRKIAQVMSVDDIKTNDFGDFFSKVEEVCRENS